MAMTCKLGMVAVLVLIATQGPAYAQSIEDHYVPDQVLVKFRPSTSVATRVASLGLIKGIEIQRIDFIDWYHIKLVDQSIGVQHAITLLRNHPAIEHIQPNHYYKPLAIPDDTQFADQWHLDNTGQNNCGFCGGDPDGPPWCPACPECTDGDDIDAVGAWNFIKDAPNVLIAMFDTGVDNHHPDLTDNLWINTAELNGEEGVDDDANGCIDDIFGCNFRTNPPTGDSTVFSNHGTTTAGVVAAVADNAEGVAGIIWNAKLVAINLGNFSDANICLALQYSIKIGAKVTNHSYRQVAKADTSEIVYDAISAACDSGLIFVASAGNDGNDNDTEVPGQTPVFPASYDLPCIISVAMTDCNDALVEFANRCGVGAPAESNYGAVNVDLGAPGKNIWTTTLEMTKPVLDPDRYRYWMGCGTSVAAPHVTAAAALLWEQNPSWTNTQVKDRILATVDVLPSLQGKVLTSGRLNLEKALDNVPPDSVQDLDPFFVSQNAIFVSWTAPGDDSSSGTAVEYDLRYSTNQISDGNFDNAAREFTENPPDSAGSWEGETVDSLQACTRYYFALKTKDNAGNWSAISNLPNNKTTCPGGGGPGFASTILPPDTEETDGVEPLVSVEGLSQGQAPAPGLSDGTGATTSLAGVVGPAAWAIIVENHRQEDGAWLITVRRDSEPEGLGDEVAGGVVIQQAGDNVGTWSTLGRFQPGSGVDLLGLSGLLDGGRMVFLDNAELQQVSADLVADSGVHTLTTAVHSRYGDVSGDLASSGGTVELVQGDVLSLTYEKAGLSSSTSASKDWYVLVSRSAALGPASRQVGSDPGPQAWQFSLGAAQPNPFTGNVRIGYTLARNTDVSIKIYNVAGRLVRTLASGTQQAGPYNLVWDARDGGGVRVSQGVYFYRMVAGDWTSKRKVVFLGQ